MNERKQPLTPDEEIETLEAQLAGTLRPVSPPRDFVRSLRERIRLPAREHIAIRLRDWRSLVLIFGGVLSGMLLIITIARAFFYLSGRRHMG
jgi:hypothetical protein